MSNGLNKKKKVVVDIKEEYERLQKAEEEKRLASEKQIGDILQNGNYQYLATVNLMGVEVALDSIINPTLAVSLRLVQKPKE